MARCQRGLSGSVQVTLLLPLAIGIFLAALQWGMVHWAQATALAAAQQASSTAARGSVEQGRQEGMAVTANGALHDVDLAIRQGATSVSAEVTGNAVRLLPLIDVGVHASVDSPRERITTP